MTYSITSSFIPSIPLSLSRVTSKLVELHLQYICNSMQFSPMDNEVEGILS